MPESAPRSVRRIANALPVGVKDGLMRVRRWPARYPKAFTSMRSRRARLVTNDAILRFWTAAARRNPAFAPLYPMPAAAQRGHESVQPAPAVAEAPRPTAAASLGSDQISATTIDQAVRIAQKYGIALMQDVLPEAQHREVCEEIESIRDCAPKASYPGVEHIYEAASPRLREIFDDIVLEIGRRIYGDTSQREFTTQLHRVQLTGTDIGDPNTIAHIDRWFPCIKLFYYPHPIDDADHSPYGFVPGSHIVDREYLDCVREAFSALPNYANPFAMRNPTGNPEFPVLTTGNSLLITYTNGLHRRMPFGPDAAPGSFRELVFFGFENAYSRANLLSHLVGK